MKCPICRLYGAPGLSSKTIFLDAVVKGSYQVGLYTGTAIERKTGIVKAKHLYNVEYVYPKGETWVDIHIYIDNMDEDEELLIKSLIGLIKATGLRLGGLRSRGYGLLKLDIENSYAVKTIFDGGPEENITKLLRGGTRVSLESLLG
jgi:CRISPR/Cas system CSM-associated protein Csm3 (group 7 of RAMP superfamily)